MAGSTSDAWHEHRRYLLDIAYRMLGSISEAEDIVQDTFTRLVGADPQGIDDIRGWLVTVTTRLCVDQLRSARSRRETYVGPYLPEPLIEPPAGGSDPAERVTLDDSVRIALLVVLERLTPAERAAFLLHDVFQMPFDAVGPIVGRSPAACRKLASRGRRRIQAETPPTRFDVDPAAQRLVAERFVAACNSGDLKALMEVLDPDVIGETDTGGLIIGAPLRPISGRLRVAKVLLKTLGGRDITLAPIPVNGEPGAIVLRDGHLLSVVALTASEGLIHHIHAIANPYKLEYVKALLNHE